MRKLRNDELNRKTADEFQKAAKNPYKLILDNVRSMNNIGSIFRTCDAFLIEELLLCGITATPPHREIHKTALGATDSVKWSYFEETTQAVQRLKNEGYTIVAIEQTECSIELQDFKVEGSRKYAFIFGNEVKGVEQQVIDMCDQSIEIPQFGTKHSFNVSVSVGIVLWELYRKS